MIYSIMFNADCLFRCQSAKLQQGPRLVDVLQLLSDLMSGSRDPVSRRRGNQLYEAINLQLNNMFLALKKTKVTLN